MAMPGHKGLLGPMGTGLLLCKRPPEPLLQGGTGSMSQSWEMPDFLPDRGEAGTANVPGIWGLYEGLRWVISRRAEKIGAREAELAQMGADGLERMGLEVFRGLHQGGVVSFLPKGMDCEEAAQRLGQRGVCLRGGLHCAPLAHESVGTLETGTLRFSCGATTTAEDIRRFLLEARGVFS